MGGWGGDGGGGGEGGGWQGWDRDGRMRIPPAGFYAPRDVVECPRNRPQLLPRESGGWRRPGYMSVGVWGPGWGTHYLFLLSAWFWAGVCPAGLVGGQDTQPGSTRAPSPAVAVVAGGQLELRAVNPHLPGRRRWPPTALTGQTVKLRGIPEGQRYRSGVATSHEHQVVAVKPCALDTAS